ncbi:MAG: hypothetical protein H6Q81_2492 [Deltaproteobacteria bacterium]|nr:hypothetical protein [Deltaproteobacteria bacterium]
MIGVRRTRFLLVLALTFGFAGTAWAEGIFAVNDAGTGNWVFDQPSVVANGTVLHMAFVGDNGNGADSDSLNTRLYYAAVNGGADFNNRGTTRANVLVTAPVAIDGGDAYVDARHPQIALRSATELAILFQARPSVGAPYKLFRALVTIDNNAVTNRRINQILDASGNDFLGSLSSVAGSPYADVYYARVGLDTARVMGNTLTLLTRTPAGTGVTPLPRLRLEGTTRSHISWAADSGTTTPSDIYYAMVKEASPGVDTLAIGATPVLGNQRWGFPNVLLPAASRVLVLAGVESGTPGIAGPVGVALLNPDAVAGYGAVSGMHGTAGTYFTMSLLGVTAATGNFADLVSPGVSIGTENSSFANSIPGDYTRPAFVHFSGKAVHFWSGQDNTGTIARNLYVTSTVSSVDPAPPVAPAQQSGCNIVDDPRHGEAGRIPGAAMLLLPAALIALRRATRKAVAR